MRRWRPSSPDRLQGPDALDTWDVRLTITEVLGCAASVLYRDVRGTRVHISCSGR